MNRPGLRRIAMLLAVVGIIALMSEVSAEPYAGYTLFGQSNGRATYLLDMDRRTVHTWNHNRNGGYSAYLLENGHVLRTAAATRPQLMGGGSQGVVQEIDWNGNLVWEFTYSSATYLAHHDIEPMPNGNVLMIAWEVKTAAEAQAAGRSRNAALWPDHIIEVQPNGANGGNIVWQWHAWDHLIQDYNQNRANYGVVADHPELLDINVSGGGGMGGGDWMHINGISYNPDLDQIVISSHYLNEIYVIDHSTTTAEAASHAGGRWGRGGDFLYRWGKPANYDAPGDQVFRVVHCSIWVPAGLPGAGNIMAFNNREGQGTSMIVEINPPYDDQGNYVRGVNGAYGPANPIWTYTANGFYSNHLGGCQRLPNGNTFIVESTSGYLFEVNAQGNEQWSHNYGREVARGLRYAEDYPGVYALHPVNNGVLAVNEILVDNEAVEADQDGEYDAWLELYNNGNSDLSLWGFYLSDNANMPTKWKLPDTSIVAHDYLIVWLDNDLDQEGLHAGFAPVAQGGRVVFSAPNLTVLDNVQYGAQNADISFGRFPNGTGNFIPMLPSFASENHEGFVVPDYDAVINELLVVNLAAADQNGEFDAWIELYNSSDEALSMRGCYLSDNSQIPTRWAFPDTSIAGRSFLIVWADRDTLQAGLHVNFELGSRGGSVFLYTPQRVVIDSVLYDDQMADVSFGRYPDGEGEFILMTPSFAAANNDGILAPDCKVVINELLVENDTTASDQDGEFDGWVELFNNSEQEFALWGISLSNARNMALWAFPDITIAGQSYLIVWLDNDVLQAGLHANFELSEAGGSLFILGTNSNVIDSVGYGAQTADISLGRYPNGTGGFIPMTPSFAARNNPGVVSVASDPPTSPDCYLLSPCHPNPFNSTTKISFQIPLAGEVEVTVYTLQGQRVARLASDTFRAGFHEVVWNGVSDQGFRCNSGMYLCVLRAGERNKVQKLILLN